MPADNKLSKSALPEAMLCHFSPMPQIRQNLSIRRIPLSRPRQSTLCVDTGAQCKGLKLNILESLCVMSQRFMLSLRSYPGTTSTFTDTCKRRGPTPRHLKNKYNDDSVKFSGVGGDTKTHPLWLLVIAAA